MTVKSQWKPESNSNRCEIGDLLRYHFFVSHIPRWEELKKNLDCEVSNRSQSTRFARSHRSGSMRRGVALLYTHRTQHSIRSTSVQVCSILVSPHFIHRTDDHDQKRFLWIKFCPYSHLRIGDFAWYSYDTSSYFWEETQSRKVWILRKISE